MSTSSLNSIAVVGMGGIFPDAENLDQYWENILSRKVSIYDAPEKYLNKNVFFDSTVKDKTDKNDKTYTRICGVIKDFKFDSTKFRIPPAVLKQMDDNQKASIYAASQAISEVSLDNVKKEKIAVIMGDGSYDTLHSSLEKRLVIKEITQTLEERGAEKKLLEIIEREFLSRSSTITEDSAPGTLRNITAGRIANIYDFHGPSYTINSACASGLTAIIKGVEGLHSGVHDVVVCGATDMSINSIGFSYFSAMNALSPDGAFPFDERANGFVIGQGAGVVVLKRVEDAVRDGDKIYAVIKGYGQASDGKGKAIAAPEKKWQAKTIEQACRMAGFSAETIEYIEAHGTATKVGDYVETQALKEAFKNLGAKSKNYCGLSSVKSNIGHLKSAAGIAGFIKSVLSIHNKILPPTAGFKKINPKLEIEDSPFYVIDKAEKWEEKSHPRRAGVSAFGFGGADYHIVIEEYHKENTDKPETDNKESHNIFFSSDSTEGLIESCKRFGNSIKNGGDFPELVFRNNCSADRNSKYKLALTIRSYNEFSDKLSYFIKNYKENPEALKLRHVYFSQNKSITSEKTALMFPGQGAQYSGMMEGYRNYSVYSRTFDMIDVLWDSKNNRSVSSIITASDDTLRQTEYTHPAVFSTSISLYNQLKSMGLKADNFIGHSLGEITALTAGGVLDLKDSVGIINHRGESFRQIKDSCDGLMAAVKAGKKEVEEQIRLFGQEVFIANLNSPEQTIVSGERTIIKDFCLFLERAEIRNSIINVSYPFHSPMVKNAEDIFREDISNIAFNDTKSRICCNHLADYYPGNGDKVKDILGNQITSSVRFTESIKKLYMDGVRLFIEIGPSSILSNLVKKILKGKDIDVLTTNYKNKDDNDSFNNMLCSLFTMGIELDLLKENRNIKSEASIKKNEESPRIVFSGASIGLPGSYKESFRDDNFEQLFNGNNLIEKLSESEKNSIVDLQVSKLIKSEKGASFKILSNINDVIQLAGKAGKLDLEKYLIPEKEIMNMSSTIAMAVAAGYEALRDAKIPLVREYNRTASGKSLPGRWMLPEEMQEETGIIFPNGFPMVDPVITEVSRYISYIYGTKIRKDLIEFYETIISKIDDYQTKKKLTDWFAVHFLEISDNPGEDDIYRFNHHFMNQIASQANNRLASYIGAKGPNFQINAACSSTSTAISLAEDMIKSGRAKRMIIIGGDDPTSKTNMPLLGSGFLCTGAATTNGNIYEAAVPFDKRRNGMIMGSGAIGIVIEASGETEKRGLNPVCELMGSHLFNTAGHASRIEFPHYEKELTKFIDKIENEYGVNRQDMANSMIYMSHETYTPAKGGCSQTEAKALQSAFGSGYSNILVTNTKGMTGHTMGASIEDAVAAKALQYRKCPPIVNHSVPDPELKGLKLSSGGDHECEYALKMAAGFGAQGNYILLRKMAEKNDRFFSKDKYDFWLKSVSNDGNNELEYHGRLLVLKDNHIDETTVIENVTEVKTEVKKNKVEKGSSEEVIKVISEVTGYPSEMLEADMEMEADLGIDTVKQATVLAMLGDKFGFEESEDFKLSNYPTIGHIIKLFSNTSTANMDEKPESKVKQLLSNTNDVVIKIVSEVTGYPEEMLEPGMEMEADLGIDTVKQATVLAMLGDKFGFEESEDFRLSDFPTIGHIINLFNSNTTNTEAMVKQTTATATAVKVKTSDTKDEVIKIISEVTGYPEEMLEPGMEMEADLGIDTVKQATVLAMLGDSYGFKESEDFKLSDYPTIGHLINLFNSNIGNTEAMVKQTTATATAVKVKTTDTKDEVIKIISEVTGYPEEMLEPGMEMEADLGIDTVKQATVLAMLGDSYGFKESEDFKLSDYPTIGHIVSLFENENRETEEKVEDSRPEISEQDVPHNLTRQVVVSVEEELGKKDFDIKDSRIILIGNYKRDEITKLLTNKGAKVLTTEVTEVPDSEKIDLIIDTTVIGENCSDIEDIVYRSGEALFRFYKELDEKLDEKPYRVICLIDNENSERNPVYGAYSGFYKALRKEWDCSVKIISTDSDLSDSILVNEIEKRGTGVEISYGNEKRNVLKVDEKEIQSTNRISYDKDTLFLVTGGATGITAEIIKELAERYSCKFAVTGRTVIPDNIDELCCYTEEQFDDLKITIHEDLKSKHKKVTPIMVSREFDKISKAVKVQNFINHFSEKGIELTYYSGDAADFNSMEGVVKEVKSRYGTIDGVIHAAGVEKSNYINKKTVEEFNTVYNTKVAGAYNLTRLLKNEPLKLAVAFSSISGRFGNAAQLDYSAANNFLNFWIKDIKGNYKDINAVSIGWSGWKDVGMAWRNDFVRLHSEEQGLNLISRESGIEAFINEIEHNTGDTEVIISRGLGELLEPGLSIEKTPIMPFLDRIEKCNGKIIKAYKNLSVERDEFMNQHRLGKIPLMPAVSYMELCTEYYSLVKGVRDQYVIRDLDIIGPLKLHKEQSREIVVEGELDKNADRCDMVLSYKFSPGKSKEVKDIVFSSLSLTERKPSITEFDLGEWSPENMYSKKIMDFLDPEIDSSQKVNFGPLYQDLMRDAENSKNSELQIGDNGVVYPISFPVDQIDNSKYPLDKLIINPCIIDSIFQGAAIGCLSIKNRVYLPCGAEEFGIVKAAKEVDDYRVFVKMINEVDKEIFFDAVMVNSKDEVNYYAKGIKFRQVSL